MFGRNGISFPRDESPWPSNPDGFKTVEAQAKYLAQTCFAHLRPSVPFMIVTKFIKYQLTSCSITHSTHANMLDTKYYLGVLGRQEPLFYLKMKGATFVVGAERYLCFTGGERRIVHGPLEFSIFEFRQTPLKGEFPAPPYGHKARAFSVVVGAKAIETLCLAEAKQADLLPAYYVIAAHLLGIPCKGYPIREAERKLKERTLATLLQKRSEAGENVRSTALVLGFDADMTPIKVNGIRYRPREVLEDLGIKLELPF